jgi:hypothetical protein
MGAVHGNKTYPCIAQIGVNCDKTYPFCERSQASSPLFLRTTTMIEMMTILTLELSLI